MNFIKKQTVFGWVTLGAAVLGLVAMIVYIVSGTTGYMDGQPLAALPIVFTVISILGLGALFAVADKLDRRIVGGILFVIDILLAVSLCLFIADRVQLFADVYFIPVNFPESEVASLNSSIAGMVFYILALVCVIVTGFAKQLHKPAEN